MKGKLERSELQDIKEQLDLERADNEYERNVESMVDMLVNERMKTFRLQMEKNMDEMLDRMSKNLKEPPVDLSHVLKD